MATTLLDTLTGLVSQRFVDRSAAELGESPQTLRNGYQAGFATILAGLLVRANDPGTMRQVVEFASNRALDDDAMVATLDNASLNQTASVPNATATALGGRLLSMLFGNRTADVTDAVARSTELRSSSITPLLATSAPLVLAVIGRRVRQSALSGSGLSSLLLGQRDGIVRATPAGVADILGAGAPADREVATGAGTAREFADAPPPPPAAPRTPRIVPPTERPGGARWLWPALGALALVALLWGISRRGNRPEPQTAAVVRDTTVVAESVVGTAAGARRAAATAATTAGANLGSFVRRDLPGGVSLDVPENGIESRLAGWIADPSTRVNDTTWFNFDRLLFATNSATLEPQSQEQLRNVAAILKAYPNVKAKIGGYTDSTGDAAANQRLSAQRAANVRQALVTLGVPGDRLASEGYGAKHPVADNSTEAGRAQNRRIALRVTEK